MLCIPCHPQKPCDLPGGFCTIHCILTMLAVLEQCAAVSGTILFFYFIFYFIEAFFFPSIEVHRDSETDGFS